MKKRSFKFDTQPVSGRVSLDASEGLLQYSVNVMWQQMQRVRFNGVITIPKSMDEAEEAAQRLRNTQYLGLGCESYHKTKPTYVSLMQISAEDEVVLFQFPRNQKYEMAASLVELLEDENIVKGMHDPRYYLNLIYQQRGIMISGVACTRYLGSLFAVEPNSLQAVSAIFLKELLERGRVRSSNWGRPTLMPEQITHSATAAWATRRVLLKMLEIYRQENDLSSIDEALKHSRAFYGDYDIETLDIESCSCGMPLDYEEFRRKVGDPKAVLFYLCLTEFLCNRPLPHPKGFPLSEVLPSFNAQWRPEGYIMTVHLPHLGRSVAISEPSPESIAGARVAVKAIHELCGASTSGGCSFHPLYRGTQSLKAALAQRAAELGIGIADLVFDHKEQFGEVSFSNCREFKLRAHGLGSATTKELSGALAIVALRYLDSFVPSDSSAR